MMKPSSAALVWAFASLQSLASALTVAEINGNKFISPYSGQTVTNVTGLLIARGPNGVWIRSTTPDDDRATSEAIYVFGTVTSTAVVGAIISLDGKVTEYRSANTYLYLTEITSPKNVKVLSSGNEVIPLVLGEGELQPPTVQYTALDGGDIYAVPNGVNNISAVNPVLEPTKYGLDFWESLSGELVTIKKPTVTKQPNSYGDTWVVGDWKATGRNSQGGLTMSDKDSNPEAIIIGSPLDGTKNPTTTKMGDQLEQITGIVTQTFGFYYILPLTKVTVSAAASASVAPSTLKSQGNCKGVTVGSYNVENLAPTSSHMSKVAGHIVTYMNSPDLLFIQEVQDGSGATDGDNIVSANLTLATLATAIKTAGGPTYEFVEVAPASPNVDGGAPGGNIRQAYLYRPDFVSLYKPNQGGGNDKAVVLPGAKKNDPPYLSFNPGRIEPASDAWTSSRKPLVAAWIAKGASNPFYTVNVHFTSKGGGTSLHGDVRPPINGGVERRNQQANVTASFIAEILALYKGAAVIAAGDFNEFEFVKPMKTFNEITKMKDLDVVVKTPLENRYTYAYDMNSQALDHMMVSRSISCHVDTRFEHLHLNSWAAFKDQVSDHDPSLGMFNLCG
ncbi:Endonuclease/exonuclease/phosphatase [Podospora fimiseda]|uniref:Endonuclease/exonuclease/phosphatase n=1 Tax=Podospora fimiseda TaxID=252190 RepID=A0AAN7BFV9_9PEZI|nr:Endonuclease/exonuclease/phosphatase [Podospora fimiseda]